MEPRSKPRWKFKPRGIVNHSSSRRPAVDAYRFSLSGEFAESDQLSTLRSARVPFGCARQSELDPGFCNSLAKLDLKRGRLQ